MSRRPEEVRKALATAAGLVAFDPDRTWRDVLFESDDGVLSRPEDPDRALLGAVAEEYTELDRHGDTLPERAHVDWLERILAIPRLPVLPDRVVAHATVDPKLAPAVLPRGTVLRGGKDAAGAERRYTTDDVLTAHGTTLTAVRSTVPGGQEPTAPGLIAEAVPFPLDPAAGTDAPHALRVYSPLLAFEGGTMEVRIGFTDATAASVAGLEVASWRYPLPDGEVGEASAELDGTGVRITMMTGCAAATGDPWLEVTIPGHLAVPTTLSFTEATVAVTKRTLTPQAAYLNDGLVEVSKEFQPFGAAAKRGDALYLRSDEAFAKPLHGLTVTVSVMQEGGSSLSSAAGGSGIPDYLGNAIAYQLSYIQGAWSAAMPAEVQGAFDYVAGIVSSTSTPRVEWQRRESGQWHELDTVDGSFSGFSLTDAGGARSEPVVIGGERGNMIRAFLSEGDFGWSDYQADIADFATRAVAGTTPKPVMPVPPVPPVVSSITIAYTTKPRAATKVEAVNGWTRTVQGSGTFVPFTRPSTGFVAFGLELPEAALGSTVSVYLGVDSASPCGSSATPEAQWQWWDGAAWQRLAVADGSRLLRESGLLRFVAPPDWPVECSAVDATTGRWLRLVTAAPKRLGVLTSVMPDAVLASFVSAADDPQTDPSSATALPPGTIKGTLTPVTGVKKVTNLLGVRGRGPESDGAYRRRASALARHRGRGIGAWDYEEIVSVAFAEVAAVRCLPHTDADSNHAPGSVGVVVVPDRPLEPSPRPSVSLSGRITDVLAPLAGLHATPVVLCPHYVPVRVEAAILLRPGVAALTGKAAITDALELWLHPTGTTPTRWGRSLYRSSVEAFLDALPEVDTVEDVHLIGPDGDIETVAVDPCRGLYCSDGGHSLDVQEQL